MNKAFIFDMDGVLVDSEHAWKVYDEAYLRANLNDGQLKKMGSVLGMSRRSIFEKAISCGAHIDEKEFNDNYDRASAEIYSKVTLTNGTAALAELLITNHFRLGLVTSSEQKAIDKVLPRLPFKDQLEVVISLNDRTDLKPKPNPDGYMEALRVLDADPKQSIILEDSNYGIRAAKAAGCYVVGYRAHLVPHYEQTGADSYADTMDDVIKLVEEFTRP